MATDNHLIKILCYTVIRKNLTTTLGLIINFAFLLIL